MNIEVNFMAVLLAGIVSMGLGFLWYSQMVLGKQWMKAHGYTSESLKKAQKEMGKLYSLSFVLSLIMAYVLFHVMVFSESFFHYPMLQTGITSAFWMWLGFIMPVQATATIFSDKKNWKLFGIDTGYQLVSVVAMGAVLALV